MIGNVLRTFLGGPLIAAAMPVHATVIGLYGESDVSERALRAWCRLVLRVTGAEVTVLGEPKLDPKKSYVFVSNHTSNLDAPAILSVTPTPLRFIAKRELARIPFFGWAAKRMGHVFIDRRDKQGATRAIRRRIERGFDTGVALFFFAEGTRSTTEDLLPFKKGAAIAAIETGLDVVPIAVAGARHVLPPKGFALFRPGRIFVSFGEPIPVAPYHIDERDELVAQMRKGVEAALRVAKAAMEAEMRKAKNG
jgi:1-acyl-sn-glycerol-3-phosphate acyltransferase